MDHWNPPLNGVSGEQAAATGKQLAAVEAAHRTAQLDAAMWAWTDEETGALGPACSLTQIQTLIASGQLKVHLMSLNTPARPHSRGSSFIAA